MPNSLNILLIEDDPEDVELFTQFLHDHNIEHSVDVMTDGMMAIDYLKSGRPLPDLVVMDLNLPLVHGRDVLTHIKKSPLRNIPLIVLTTSSSEHDRSFVMSNGASKFITKPSSLSEINKMMADITELL